MLKLSPLLLVALFAVYAPAAQTPEGARAAASFQSLPGFHALPKGTPPAPVRGTPVVPVPVRECSQYVRVSGNVDLRGSGYVSKGARIVSVNLTGTTDIRDSSGRIRSGYTTVSYMATLFVNGNWVSEWARPSIYLSLYQDGRYVGQVRVDGNIHVSGWVSGDWVSVSGSGDLSGDIWVQDP